MNISWNSLELWVVEWIDSVEHYQLNLMYRMSEWDWAEWFLLLGGQALNRKQNVKRVIKWENADLANGKKMNGQAVNESEWGTFRWERTIWQLNFPDSCATVILSIMCIRVLTTCIRHFARLFFVFVFYSPVIHLFVRPFKNFTSSTTTHLVVWMRKKVNEPTFISTWCFFVSMMHFGNNGKLFSESFVYLKKTFLGIVESGTVQLSNLNGKW